MPFSGKTLDFLMENRLMDSKAWFHEHKDVFEREVKAPLVELSEALAPTMLRIDPEMEIAPRVGGTLCRVWRDTRFTKDKSLFRDHMWLNFSKNKGVFPGYPGFFRRYLAGRLLLRLRLVERGPHHDGVHPPPDSGRAPAVFKGAGDVFKTEGVPHGRGQLQAPAVCRAPAGGDDLA